MVWVKAKACPLHEWFWVSRCVRERWTFQSWICVNVLCMKNEEMNCFVGSSSPCGNMMCMRFKFCLSHWCSTCSTHKNESGSTPRSSYDFIRIVLWLITPHFSLFVSSFKRSRAIGIEHFSRCRFDHLSQDNGTSNFIRSSLRNRDYLQTPFAYKALFNMS